MKILSFFIPALTVLSALPLGLHGQTLTVVPEKPANPVRIEADGETLSPFDGLGPIFLVNVGNRSPKTYSVELKKQEKTPDGIKLTCLVKDGAWSAEYVIDVRQTKNEVALEFSPDAVVSGINPGRLTGAASPSRRYLRGNARRRRTGNGSPADGELFFNRGSPCNEHWLRLGKRQPTIPFGAMGCGTGNRGSAQMVKRLGSGRSHRANFARNFSVRWSSCKATSNASKGMPIFAI